MRLKWHSNPLRDFLPCMFLEMPFPLNFLFTMGFVLPEQGSESVNSDIPLNGAAECFVVSE